MPNNITRQGTPGLICGTASVFFLTALYFPMYVFCGSGEELYQTGDGLRAQVLHQNRTDQTMLPLQRELCQKKIRDVVVGLEAGKREPVLRGGEDE